MGMREHTQNRVPASEQDWALTWERDGSDWPNRSASRFMSAGGLNWHIQQMGQGPVVLLLHGTGAATHSWRGLAPLLAERYTVIAPDLPGHGFTAVPPPSRLSLPNMAAALNALLRRLDVSPQLVVGHSAGAAILAHMCLAGQIRPRAMISLNGALLPFRGLQGVLFSPAAKLLAKTRFFPRHFARRAAKYPVEAERMVQNVGSTLDAVGIDYYRRLMRSERHVAATLAMLSNWDLEPLSHELFRFEPALVLVAAANDRSVDPRTASRVAKLVPSAQVVYLSGLGHLAHEEEPDKIAELIDQVATANGVTEDAASG